MKKSQGDCVEDKWQSDGVVEEWKGGCVVEEIFLNVWWRYAKAM